MRKYGIPNYAKTFENKVYVTDAAFTTKAEAERYAKKVRGKGKLARTIKNKSLYYVFEHKK